MYLRKGKQQRQWMRYFPHLSYCEKMAEAARHQLDDISAMKLERDVNGDLFVEPSILANRLSTSIADLQRMMRLGLVTSTVETGTDDDDGRQRLTVRRGNTVWRAIIDLDDNVLSEEILDLQRLEHRPKTGQAM